MLHDTPAKKRATSRIRRAAVDTRLALLRAAERLFAERGVDAVSLREVSAAAGQANNSAVAYHFGSREGLVDAILERHSAPIQARYDAQLELLARQGTVELRSVMEILVLPIVAKLDDPDGGREYLSLAAQLSVSPHLPLASRPVARTPAVLRLMGMTFPFGRVPQSLMPLRMERVANTLYASIASWQRIASGGATPTSREAFEQDLIDTLVVLIEAPPSGPTLGALAVD